MKTHKNEGQKKFAKKTPLLKKGEPQAKDKGNAIFCKIENWEPFFSYSLLSWPSKTPVMEDYRNPNIKISEDNKPKGLRPVKHGNERLG